MILAVDWLFHGFPELVEFAPWRIWDATNGPTKDFIPRSDEPSDTAGLPDFWGLGPLVIWIILPALAVALAMRWSGRLAGGWHVRGVSEARRRGRHPQATDEESREAD